MTTLHRVKAYFGMVPADELDSYDGYDDDRYDSGRDRYGDRLPAERHSSDRHRFAADRYDGRYDDGHEGGYDRHERYGRARDDDRYDRGDRYDRADRYDDPRDR